MCLLTAVALELSVLVTGCARMPSEGGGGAVPNRQLIVRFTLAAPLDPAYYYFIALDTNGGSQDGPVPIVTNPSAPIPATGVPLIISDAAVPPDFYVQCHQDSFSQYRNLLFVGPPFQAGISQDRLTVVVSVDLGQVTTTAQHLELNIITSDRLLPPEGPFVDFNYDGLGPSGNSYLVIPLDVSGTYSNTDAAVPERAEDTTIGALDVVDWSVEVRLTR